MSRADRSTLATAFVLLEQSVRSIARHRGRSALSAIGIAVAIAAVVLVVALAREGSERTSSLLLAVGDNLVWVEAGSRNVAGVRTGTKGSPTLTLDDASAIAREMALIRSVSPQIDGSAQVVVPGNNWATRWRGVDPSYLEIKRFRVVEGHVFSDDDVANARNVLLIGETVRDRLYGAENPVGRVLRMNNQPFEIVGLLEPKGQSATGADQDDVVMLPYTTANQKLRPPGQRWLDDIVCSAVSSGAVAPATERIVALMRERHRILPNADDDFNIRHPEEVVKAQMEAASTFSMLLVVVACISLLVGGIGIMNMMLASISERTREIGLRLAIGARQVYITMQFLLEAVLLGLLGGAMGAGMSVVGAATIGSALGWTLHVPIDTLVPALVFAGVVGAVFGYLPARHASRLDPIEALRSE